MDLENKFVKDKMRLPRMKNTGYLALLLIILSALLPIQSIMQVGLVDRVSYNQLLAAPNGTDVSLHYSAYVVAIWRHADGTIYYEARSHNTLMNIAKNATLTALFVAGTRVTWLGIQPTNATMTAVATDTYCCGGSDKTFVTTTDLAPATGTWTPTGTGTGKISRTFTLTIAIAVTVYGTGLTVDLSHGSGANNLSAEANLPSTAPMSLVGDNVTLVWYVTIT